jgi:hypothetical protein
VLELVALTEIDIALDKSLPTTLHRPLALFKHLIDQPSILGRFSSRT